MNLGTTSSLNQQNLAKRFKRGIYRTQNYIFIHSERGGKSAAITYTLMDTAKLNKVDPRDGSPTQSYLRPQDKQDR
jgi:hypothetical protein